MPCTWHVRGSQIGRRTRLTIGTNMQDYDEALRLDASCALALVRKGKALLALKRTEVRAVLLQSA